MEIKRKIFNELGNEIAEPKISILLGARQVGKTTLLRQLEKSFRKQNKKIFFYNLESPADLSQLSGSQQKVIDKLLSHKGTIFIDEFHYLENASKIFKSIYDQLAPIKIYASGSSSLEIHKHLKESLAGRFFKTMIFPLTLSELNQVPNTSLKTYLQWGGMPGLIHCKSSQKKVELLDNIVSTYITKDIKGLIKEENIRAFNMMLYFLATHQGSLIATSELAKETGLSEPTLKRHLDILSQTYVGHILPSYSRNLANELKKSKKVYLFDIGIRNSLLKDFRVVNDRNDKGTLYETFVCLHLIWQLKPNMEIRFWRTKKGDEVDFVLIKNRVPVPAEVKSDLKKPVIPSGMKKFLSAYKEAPFGIVFNNTIEDSVYFDDREIQFQRLERAESVDYLKSVV